MRRRCPRVVPPPVVKVFGPAVARPGRLSASERRAIRERQRGLFEGMGEWRETVKGEGSGAAR